MATWRLGDPYVIFTLNVQFFGPATISGVFVSPTALSGALTGSGYSGQAITLIQP